MKKETAFAVVIEGKELPCFAISPKTDCPHLKEEYIENLKKLLSENKDLITCNSCEDCQDQSENWVCTVCLKVFCARSVKSHMVNHNEKTNHDIVLSFSDGSFWCYVCDSYIITKQLEHLQRIFGKIKYPEEEQKETKTENVQKIEEAKKEDEDEDDNKNEKKPKLEEAFEHLTISEKKEKTEFSYEDFIQGIKTKKYQKVIFLTGAGISVSAGIPDFRTPGTGIYSKLEKYNLPYPEAVFELGYFKKNPKAFYTVSNGFLTAEVHPTTSHFFQKMLYDHGVLLHIFTQNIDGLELDAGVPLDKLCQAHGHLRTAHCIKCHQEHDAKKMMECIKKEEIYKCDAENCGGLIKPDVVFFGEKLPVDFFSKSFLIEDTDLVVVMGTSLAVFPFANLISLIHKSVPIVLINRENSLHASRENFLFIKGDIDENVEKIVGDLGMKENYEKIKNEVEKTKK